jgi:septal ring factor EnvC (AmiA/AmiB activator)
MARKILVVLLLCSSAACAAELTAETTTSIGVAPVQVSTAEASVAPAAPVSQSDFDGAISALNYKIELIQNRYISLVSDMNALTAARKDITEGIAGQITQQLKPLQDDMAQMADQIKLIRDELSQVQEDLGIILSNKKNQEHKQPPSN